MSLEPFLRREWATLARSSRAFRDRGSTLVLLSLVVLGSFAVWDQWGWDRSSVDGALWFGVCTLGLTVLALAALALPIVIPRVAFAIASERERQGLETLLASRFTNLEIVLGAMASGLFRYANVVAAGLPVAILMMALGGVAPVWFLLALLGLAATAVLMAAVSVVVSVVAKSGSRAVGTASSLFVLWVGAPATFVILEPMIWPGSPPWLNGFVLGLVDASPSGLLLSLAGVISRPGGLALGIVRMVVFEGVGSLVLVGWAVVRLRPIVRQNRRRSPRSTFLKSLRKALQPVATRPPCGDDPVLWHEMNSHGGVSLSVRLLSQAISLVMLLGLGTGLWWFAEPAFQELAIRGYQASPEALAMPSVDPIARLLMTKGPASSGPFVAATAGQARLEFNIVLRQVSALFLMGFIAVAFGTALETLKGEQTRDTWLALISTPLSGGEILWGKIRGTIWKVRDGIYTLLGLWTIGLISGAIHPFGFFLAVALLIATGAFFIAQGQTLAIFSLHPDRAGKPAIPTSLMPILMVASLVLVAAPMILLWGSLFTYEDYAATIQGGIFPQFTQTDLANAMRARAVLATSLSGLTILALGAALLIQTNARSFDEAIGRPTTPAFRPRRLPTSASRAQAVCNAVTDL